MIILVCLLNGYFGYKQKPLSYPLWSAGIVSTLAFLQILLLVNTGRSRLGLGILDFDDAFFSAIFSGFLWSFLGYYIGKGAHIMFSPSKDKSDVGGST